MSILGVIVVVVAASATYVVAFHPLRKTDSYCALMPDSIGLYPGNHVTMRGIAVGTVTAVVPQGTKVRVEFTVARDHPLLADAAATTVSDTVVADRDLAVLSGGQTTARWDRSRCLTKTLTPKSITQTLDALAQLSGEVTGADQDNTLGRALGALNTATAGTGPQLNEIIRKLGSALNSPDAAIGHLAGLIDSLSSLSEAIRTHWGDIKSMLQRMGPVLDQVNNELFTETVVIIDGFQRVLPMFNDLTTLFADPIFEVLDASIPLLRFIGAHVGSLTDIVDRAPVLASAFQTAAAPGSGRTGLVYAPPTVAIPQGDAEQLCAAVNAIAPQRCTGVADGKANLQLVQLILGTAGAQ
ncbi:MlaD family protein [Nocardia sp. NPDC004722]